MSLLAALTFGVSALGLRRLTSWWSVARLWLCGYAFECDPALDVSIGRHPEPLEKRANGNDDTSSESPGGKLFSAGCVVGSGAAKSDNVQIKASRKWPNNVHLAGGSCIHMMWIEARADN